MTKVLIFAFVASVALPLGAAIGVRINMSRTVLAWLLGFASGALVSAVAFELFDIAFEHGGAWRSGLAFLAGATVFVVADKWIDRWTQGRHRTGAGIGFALLAGVTLDGVPENLAMGVSLIEGGGLALLFAIFASNLPEAIVGAEKMKEAGIPEGTAILIWSAAALVLGAAVVAGYVALDGVQESTLAIPLGFAAGAVLASLADTLMPEAFAEGGINVAYATSLGFLVAYLLSAV
ncbi:MAG: zinc permease [Actinomycetota bacterium]|nr:zinc permease [Actinomycetota bacterium]